MAVTDIVLRTISDSRAYQEDIRQATDRVKDNLKSVGEFAKVLDSSLGSTFNIVQQTTQVLTRVGRWSSVVNFVGKQYATLVSWQSSIVQQQTDSVNETKKQSSAIAGAAAEAARLSETTADIAQNQGQAAQTLEQTVGLWQGFASIGASIFSMVANIPRMIISMTRNLRMLLPVLTAIVASWGPILIGILAVANVAVRIHTYLRLYNHELDNIRQRLDPLLELTRKNAEENKKALDPIRQFQKELVEINNQERLRNDLIARRKEMERQDQTDAYRDWGRWLTSYGDFGGGIGEWLGERVATMLGVNRTGDIAEINRALNPVNFKTQEQVEEDRRKAVEDLRKAFRIEPIANASDDYRKRLEELAKAEKLVDDKGQPIMSKEELQHNAKLAEDNYFRSMGIDPAIFINPQEEYAKNIKRLNDDLAQGLISAEKHRIATQKLHDDMMLADEGLQEQIRMQEELARQQQALVDKYREMAETPFMKHERTLWEMAEAAQLGGFNQDMINRLQERANADLASSLGLSGLLDKLKSPTEKLAEEMENLNLYAIRVGMGQNDLIRAQKILRDSYLNNAQKGMRNEILQSGTAEAYKALYERWAGQQGAEDDTKKMVRNQQEGNKIAEKMNKGLASVENTLKDGFNRLAPGAAVAVYMDS